MGRIHNDRPASTGHDRQAAHVRHQRVIAEACPPLGQKNAVIAGRCDLVGNIGHVPGGQKLALLDFDDPTRLRRRDQKIGLTAEKRRDLQDIDDLGHGAALCRLVHVRHDGQTVTLIPPKPDIPQTGDNSNLGFWIGLGAVALGGLVAVIIIRVKSRKDEDDE